MNSKQICMYTILICMLTACALKTEQAPKIKASPAEALYLQAQKSFSQGQLDSAIAAYQSIVDTYPQTPQAQVALMNIAAIHERRAHWDQARASYDQLMQRYPDGAYAADAQIKRINTYRDAGDTETWLKQMITLLKTAGMDDEQAARLHFLLGNAYVQSNRMDAAFAQYAMAWALSAETQKEAMLNQCHEAGAGIPNPQLVSILTDLAGRNDISRLWMDMGELALQNERYGRAAILFSAFLSAYPQSPLSADAQTYRMALQNQYGFQPFTIGCLLPLTGRYEKFGLKALDGIQLALRHVGDGKNQNPMRLIIRDSGSDRQQTQSAVQELADLGVGAIAGPLITAHDAAAAAQEARIPIVTLTAKDQVIESGDFVFRNFLTPRMQVEALVNFAVTQMQLKTAAILYPEEKYGRTYQQLFTEAFIAAGGIISVAEAYGSRQMDFKAPIQKLSNTAAPRACAVSDIVAFASHFGGGAFYPDPLYKMARSLTIGSGYENNPTQYLNRPQPGVNPIQTLGPPAMGFDALFIPDSADKVGLILPQLAYYDVTGIHLMGAHLWYAPKLIEMAGSYAQGAIIVTGFFSDSRAPHIQRFVTDFEAAFNRKPGYIEAIAYDTATILMQLVKSADPAFRTVVRDGLIAMPPFNGLTGRTAFAPSGESIKTPALIEIKQQRFIEITQ